MTDKEEVVDRLLGECECESGEFACGERCPAKYIGKIPFGCLRDREHIGKHFTCNFKKHRILEWD